MADESAELDLDLLAAHARSARMAQGDWAMDYGMDVPKLIEMVRELREQVAALESVKALHHWVSTQQYDWSRRNNAEFGILVRELGEALGEA